MLIFRAISISVFLPLVLLLNACSGNFGVNTNSTASNAVSTDNSNPGIIPNDDIEELGKIVKLPFTPEEVTFVELTLNDNKTVSRVPTTSDGRKIVAVIKFSNENANQLIAQAKKYKPPVPSDIDAEVWFPPELIAKSQVTGDEYLKGVEYGANDFLQPPYTNGKLTRINNTNYFALELTSF